MAKYSHLNSEDRSHIETGLNNRQSSFKEIDEKVGKDCSTISKETLIVKVVVSKTSNFYCDGFRAFGGRIISAPI